MEPERLFSKRGSLRDFLDLRKSSIRSKIDSENTNYLLNVSQEDYCKFLMQEFLLNPPELQTEKTYINEHREADIDVSQDHIGLVGLGRKRGFLKK